MEEKKVKKEHPKLGKMTKISAILASIVMFIPCLAIAVFGILDIAGVMPLLGEARFYNVTFKSDETVLTSLKIKRGEVLKYSNRPEKEGYNFMGWDIDGNKIPDVLPRRVYGDINAVAVWSKINENPTIW